MLQPPLESALLVLVCGGACGFIQCVIEKMKKTARLGNESGAFDARVLLGLDRLGLVPVWQRHERMYFVKSVFRV